MTNSTSMTMKMITNSSTTLSSDYMYIVDTSSTSDTTSTTTMIPEDEEECGNSHIISVDALLSFRKEMDRILLFSTLISSILQIYVMYCALKHIKKKTTDKCMHVFLLSMTFADFLLTALCYPVELAPRGEFVSPVPRFLNTINHIACWIALIVSSLSLVFLNLDKLFYFRFPLRYSEIFTRSRAIILISITWLFSIIFVTFAWMTESFHCIDDDCKILAIFPNRLHIYIPFMIFVGVIPTVTSLVVAIFIMKIVSQHRKQLAEERSLFHPGSTGRSNSIFAIRMRTFYFIFMTTVFTAITLLPYRLVGLQRSINPSRTPDCLTILFLWVMMYMVSLNSIINPLLTVTILPQYRMPLIRFFVPKKTEDSPYVATTVDL